MTADAVAANVPETSPAGIVTIDGTWTAELSLETLTPAPPTGAELLSVIVPVVLPGPISAVGLKVRDPTTTGTGLTISLT